MSRPAKMRYSAALGYFIRQSELDYLNGIFCAAILNLSGGLVKRKASTVQKKSSEEHLLAVARKYGFRVKLHGDFYLIYNVGVVVKALL